MARARVCSLVRTCVYLCVFVATFVHTHAGRLSAPKSHHLVIWCMLAISPTPITDPTLPTSPHTPQHAVLALMDLLSQIRTPSLLVRVQDDIFAPGTAYSVRGDVDAILSARAIAHTRNSVHSRCVARNCPHEKFHPLEMCHKRLPTRDTLSTRDVSHALAYTRHSVHT